MIRGYKNPRVADGHERRAYPAGMPRTKKNAQLRDAPRVTVVGIGASAGGIEALREFFDAVPMDLGVAYAVIVHLAPDHKSELASILSRRTGMPVMEVTDQPLELKPDHVYVISPDRKLEIGDSTLSATPLNEPRGAPHGRRCIFPLARSEPRRWLRDRALGWRLRWGRGCEGG